MKILKLTAENIKKLSVVEISPDGNMIQITGKNGQGKTSVLDSIWWALAGADHIQKVPIRKGEDSGRIELKLGDGSVELIVERTFTKAASYLKVSTSDGAKYPSPQKMLDDLLGALTFGPLTFMRMAPNAQYDQLRRLLGLDFSKLDEADKADYEERRDLNRDLTRAKSTLASMPEIERAPEEKVDEDAVMQRLAKAGEVNSEIAKHENDIETAVSLIEQLRGDMAGIQARIDKGEGLLKELRGFKMPEPVDTAKAEQDVRDARTANERFDAAQHRKAKAEDVVSLESKSQALTDAMAARKKKRTEAIADADTPIEGLSLEDGAVTFKGLPLEQSSDAEQLTISTAIAAALSPKLRVIRIRDGSLLDEDAMANLAAFADERDFQIWIERVDSSGEVGIVMEDGHIHGAAVKEPEDQGGDANEKVEGEREPGLGV